MPWDAIGAVGEVLGAVGVLCTLIYLSIQIRQNTQETHNATLESVMSADANYRQDLINTPIPGIMVKMEAGEELTAEERMAVVYYLQAYMQGWEVAYYLNKKGSLPDDVLNAIAFRRMATMDTTRSIYPWSSIKAGYTPDFQKHVSERWEDFESRPKPWDASRSE